MRNRGHFSNSFLALAVLVGTSVPNLGVAQQINGNELYEACRNEEPVQLGFCIGYIIGYSEGAPWGAFMALKQASPAMSAETANGLINAFLGSCPPSEASNSQLRDVLLKYMTEHPETRHESARTLIWQAYAEAFPCK